MEKHIVGACARDMCNCAAARAAKDMGFANAEVSPHRAWLREHDKDYWLRYVIHWPERTIIRCFDKDGGFPQDIICFYAPSTAHRIGRPAAKNKRPRVPTRKNNKRRVITLRNHPKHDAEITPPTKEARNRILKALERHMNSKL
jgi:hypothetical protein